MYYTKLQSTVFVVTALKLIRHFARGGDGGALQSTRGILIERCTRALIKFLHPLDNIDFLSVCRKFNSILPPFYAAPSRRPLGKSRIENLRTNDFRRGVENAGTYRVV